MASSLHVEGAAVLEAALKELANMRSPEWKATMRASVRNPMQAVMKRALGNIAAISPGKAETHRTFLGRIVTSGFAARSVAMVVKVFPQYGRAVATLGVKREAFYALSFFELGTSTIPRHPWLTPALESSTDSAVKEVGAAMRRRIVAIARKRARQSTGVRS